MSGSDVMIAASTAAIAAALISLITMSPPLGRRRGGLPRRAGPGWAGGLDRLDLVGGEVEEPAVAPLQLGRWVVFRADRHVHLAVDVVQHGLHRRRAPGQEQVLGVGAPGAGPH